MSTAEVRREIKKELAVFLPPDPMDQTDDNVFNLFDADGDE